MNSYPNLNQIARRALVLKPVIIHAISSPPPHILKQISEKMSAEEFTNFKNEASANNAANWQRVKEIGLWEDMSPAEKEFAGCFMDTMDHGDQINFSWRMEAMAMILWALNVIEELPPIDEMVKHEILKDFPADNDVQAFLQKAKLRSREEIEEARNLLEMWNWRSRTRQLMESAPAGSHNFDEIIRSTARKCFDDGLLSEITDEDFTAFSKAFRDLDDSEWRMTGSIIQERHFALNWLCAYADNNNWDETPTDT